MKPFTLPRRSLPLFRVATSLAARVPFAALVALVVPSSRALAQTNSAIPPPRAGGYLQTRATYVTPTRWSFTLNRARFSLEGGLPNRSAA